MQLSLLSRTFLIVMCFQCTVELSWGKLLQVAQNNMEFKLTRIQNLATCSSSARMVHLPWNTVRMVCFLMEKDLLTITATTIGLCIVATGRPIVSIKIWFTVQQNTIVGHVLLLKFDNYFSLVSRSNSSFNHHLIDCHFFFFWYLKVSFLFCSRTFIERKFKIIVVSY